MTITSPKMDATVASATLDPWHVLPSLVFMSASSSEATTYSAASGYTHRPDWPATPAELAQARKMTTDDLHDLWSASKMISILCALQLVEQGKITLHGDASEWVPELKTLKRLDGFEEDGTPILVDNDVPVTVHMMMTHTSGWTYETNPDYTKVMRHLGLLPPYFEDSTREAVSQMPVLFQPGKHWHYGMNQDWLTLVIQNASGLSLEDYEQKFLFAPLGIFDMTYRPDVSKKLGMSFLPNPKVGPNGTGIFQQDYPWPADDAKRLGYDAKGCTFPPNHQWGGSGLFGSPASYLAILRMLLRGGLGPDGCTRVLEQATVDLMFQDHLKDDQQRTDLAEGLGDRTDPFSKKHGGLFPGSAWGYGGILAGEGYPSGRSKGALSWSGFAGTYWVVDREKNVAFLCWTQVIAGGGPELFEAWEVLETELYKEVAKAA